MESMTGYGRSSSEAEGLRIVVELRGVNHKALDIHIALPSVLLCHELDCRKAVRERINRGHLDLRVTCEFVGEQAVEVRYAEGMALAVGRLASQLQDSGVLARGMTLGDLLSIPGAVQVGLGPEMEERSGALLKKNLEAALDRLIQTRREEGGRLLDQFRAAQATLAAQVAKLDGLRQLQLEISRENLNQRVRQMGVSVDAGRMEQEIALAAERSDVAEEVVRLQAHASALSAMLESQERDLGKRLDHLFQEMQREISTLLAKSSLIELTQVGLESRLLVEQLREQVQNVA